MARPYQISALNSQVPYRELTKNITASAYTVSPEDNNDIIVYNGTAAGTINLPPAASSEGMSFKIFNNVAFNLTIDPQGAETIDDGRASIILYREQGTRIFASGGAWYTEKTTSAFVTKGNCNIISGMSCNFGGGSNNFFAGSQAGWFSANACLIIRRIVSRNSCCLVIASI